MIMTMTQAARQLGIPYQHLRKNIDRGVVSAKRQGTVVLVDPEQARKQLEANGFFWRSMAIRQGQSKGQEKRTAQVAS